ncbi:MAG: 30S ribosomal protein S6 [Firmicutes bacterium]|nr:30S ribosomal protein S6 [Bacillota bacterium]
MPMYEVMFIIQPDMEGDLLEEAINRVRDIVEKEGARIVSLKRIGKRRLAYEINDFKEGYYVLLNIEAERTIVPVLEHFFKVTEGYLRYIVIRLEQEKEKEKEKEDNKESVEENAENAEK